MAAVTCGCMAARLWRTSVSHQLLAAGASAPTCRVQRRSAMAHGQRGEGLARPWRRVAEALACLAPEPAPRRFRWRWLSACALAAESLGLEGENQVPNDLLLPTDAAGVLLAWRLRYRRIRLAQVGVGSMAARVPRGSVNWPKPLGVVQTMPRGGPLPPASSRPWTGRRAIRGDPDGVCDRGVNGTPAADLLRYGETLAGRGLKNGRAASRPALRERRCLHARF